MADFHSTAATSPAISAFGKIEAIRINTEENFSQTEKYIGRAITPKQYRRIKEYTDEVSSGKSCSIQLRAARAAGSGTATATCMPSMFVFPTVFVFLTASSLTTGSAIAM